MKDVLFGPFQHRVERFRTIDMGFGACKLLDSMMDAVMTCKGSPNSLIGVQLVSHDPSLGRDNAFNMGG